MTNNKESDKRLIMKIKQFAVLAALLVVKQATACYNIMDPTYDFSFKTLFGSSGWNGKKDRLKSLINSIIKPYLNITVTSLEYENSESTTDNSKDMMFDILTKCTCTYNKQNENSFVIDVEMQRVKSNEYLTRTNMYGARLLDLNSQCNLDYKDQIKNIIISIIDDELNGLNNVCVFAVRPYIENIFSYGETKIDALSQIADPCTLQIYIQLPALCRAMSAFQGEETENDCWIKNEWFKLLGSRRLCKGNKVAYVEEGIYDISTQKYDNEIVKDAITVLNELSNDAEKYRVDILRNNRKIQEYQGIQTEIKNLENQLAQKDEELAQKDEELAQKDDKITRMQYIKDLRQNVRKYRKELKKGNVTKPKRRKDLPEVFMPMNDEAIIQYIKDEDDSITGLEDFLKNMEED